MQRKGIVSDGRGALSAAFGTRYVYIIYYFSCHRQHLALQLLRAFTQKQARERAL